MVTIILAILLVLSIVLLIKQIYTPWRIEWYIQDNGKPYYLFKGPDPETLYKQKSVKFKLRKIHNTHIEINEKEDFIYED